MALQLVILRHGAAVGSHPSGDAERPLRPAGRAAVDRLGQRLAVSGWRPSRVFSSPYRRARETAERVLAASGWALPVEILAELIPGADPDDLIASLAALDLGDSDLVLLVSHQPLVGHLTWKLTGREVRFSPGDVIRVVLADGLGSPGALADL